MGSVGNGAYWVAGVVLRLCAFCALLLSYGSGPPVDRGVGFGRSVLGIDPRGCVCLFAGLCVLYACGGVRSSVFVLIGAFAPASENSDLRKLDTSVYIGAQNSMNEDSE